MDRLTNLEARFGWMNVAASQETMAHSGSETSDPAWAMPFCCTFLLMDARPNDARSFVGFEAPKAN